MKERVRDEIRAEIAKRDPIETARAPLELIAESSIRFIEDGGSLGYKVVDAEGTPRTKAENGAVVDFTVQDLVAELQAAHPTLFRSAEPARGAGGAAEAGVGGSSRGAPAGTKPFRDRLDLRGGRDWLILDPGARSSVPSSPDQDASSAGSPTGPADKDVSRDRRAPDASATKPAPVPAPPFRQRSPGPVAAEALGSSTVRRLCGALAGVGALLLGGYLLLGSDSGAPSRTSTASREAPPASRAPEPSSAPAPEPTVTGTTASPSAPAGGTGSVSGVPEVIDTGTLRFDGKIVRLFGVEWSRGGQAEDLTRYLRGREVACQPASAAGTYRCQVDGRDLSEVVLFNGGGRAAPNATQELVAAEAHARTERIGVWRK